MNSDLDQGIDESGWLQEHPVYCPVTWCTAHKFRFDRCGDGDGPYVGIHEARIAYVRQAAALDVRQVRMLMASGLAEAEAMQAYGVLRLLQDAVDRGDLVGRQGRRRLVPLSPTDGEECD